MTPIAVFQRDRTTLALQDLFNSGRGNTNFHCKIHQPVSVKLNLELDCLVDQLSFAAFWSTGTCGVSAQQVVSDVCCEWGEVPSVLTNSSACGESVNLKCQQG
jgi:hypothetical protein